MATSICDQLFTRQNGRLYKGVSVDYDFSVRFVKALSFTTNIVKIEQIYSYVSKQCNVLLLEAEGK